ncbi:MAG: CAP domain-containing protein [Patescibacteria group bacterium]
MNRLWLHFVPHKENHHRPHAMAHRHLAFAGITLVALKVLALGLLVIWPKEHAASQAITGPAIIALTNESRRAQELPALKEDQRLKYAAQLKANDMLLKGYFAHESPSGTQAWDFMRQANYPYAVAGENLAVHYSEAEDVQNGWMLSPSHRQNILDARYTDIGVGIAQGLFENEPSVVVVQMFGSTDESKGTGPLNMFPGRSVVHAASTQDLFGSPLPYAKLGSTTEGAITFIIVMITAILTFSMLLYVMERKTHHGHLLIAHALGIIGTGIIIALW